MKKVEDSPKAVEYRLFCGPDLILIIPDTVERDGPIIMSDEEKKNLSKEQNRGRIICVGESVSYWQVGDYVSFYKGASTTIKESGIEYVTIHKNHVLVRFAEKSFEI